MSDTARQVANLMLGALVLGPFVGNRPWSAPLLAAGLALWAFFVLAGILLLIGDQS